MTPDLASLVVIALAAVLAPIVADLPMRFAVHLVVVEIALGIVIGPQVLDIARPDAFIDALANFGLAALFFLAGAEIDFPAIKGRPAAIAGIGWLTSVGLGFAAAGLLTLSGTISDLEVVAIALTTTALGVLVPVLHDADIRGPGLGAIVLATGTVGELGPIVVISVFFAAHGSLAGALLLSAFAVVVVACALLATRAHSARVSRVVQETMHASGQLAVRLCMFVLIALVALASKMGLDIILGAFAAGMIVNLCGFNQPAMEPLRVKIQAIAFGFFVPIFFIRTGMVFDLDSLLASPAAIAELPIFLALFLVVRGVPTALIARGDIAARDTAPLALLSATALPLVVAITEIGVSAGQLARSTASSMVGAAMLSVLLFPLLAMALRGTGGRASPDEEVA